MLYKLVANAGKALAFTGKTVTTKLKGNGTKDNPGLKAAWAAGTIAGVAAFEAPSKKNVPTEKQIREAAKELGLAIPKDSKDW
jgi:hypothetical protein